jgi:hypothetical protein
MWKKMAVWMQDGGTALKDIQEKEFMDFMTEIREVIRRQIQVS